MESLTKLHCPHYHQPLSLSANHRRSSFLTPLSSVSFRTLQPPPFSSIRLPSIRASSSSSLPLPNHSRRKSTNPLFSPLVRTTCITIAAAALFFTRLQPKPAIAVPVAPPTVESLKDLRENDSTGEEERLIEEQLSNNPSDIEALRALMEIKIKERKLAEAIQVIDRLIELQPEESEWPLLKAHMYIYTGDYESSRNGFEEILKKDPYRVEAYHGLVMATSEMDEPFKDLLKRVEDAMEFCKKQKRNSDVRDFKLLIAQVKVMEGKYFDALKAYQELVKEEPRDFRPYLCQGIIYTLLKKKDEAEKQFEKFRRLIPKNHPYKEYFEENMFASKFFSQKVEREGAGVKS